MRATQLFKYDSKTTAVTLFVANGKKEDILSFSISLYAFYSRIELPYTSTFGEIDLILRLAGTGLCKLAISVSKRVLNES